MEGSWLRSEIPTYRTWCGNVLGTALGLAFQSGWTAIYEQALASMLMVNLALGISVSRMKVFLDSNIVRHAAMTYKTQDIYFGGAKLGEPLVRGGPIDMRHKKPANNKKLRREINGLPVAYQIIRKSYPLLACRNILRHFIQEQLNGHSEIGFVVNRMLKQNFFERRPKLVAEQ